MKAFLSVLVILVGALAQAAMAGSPYLNSQLRQAAGLGDLTYVRDFLAKGASVNSVDRRGASALSEAVVNSPGDVTSYLPVIDELLNAGADVNLAWPYSAEYRVPIFFGSLLTDERGRRPIDQRIVAKLVASNSAQLETLNNNGHTALYYAAETDDPEAIELLANAGADVNHPSQGKTDFGYTPLMAAIRNGAAEAFETLLFVPHVDINAHGADGSTPLTLARCMSEHTHQTFWVDDLLSKGAR